MISDRRRSGHVAFQRAASAQARAITNRPRSTIAPVSSAIEMNTPGGSRPRVGWRHRTSPSSAAIAPSASATIGW